MHGIEKMKQMDIFYHAINYTSKVSLMHHVVVHLRERVLKRPISSLKICLRVTIKLHLKLQGATTN